MALNPERDSAMLVLFMFFLAVVFFINFSSHKNCVNVKLEKIY